MGKRVKEWPSLPNVENEKETVQKSVSKLIRK
jgi:hypothetical protein